MYINDLSYYEDKVLDCFGDSTTWGDNGVHTGSNKISWVHGFQHLIPFAEVRNYGIKGSRIADCGDRDDSFAKRVKEIKVEDADYMVIFGGVNDFQHSVPLGEFSIDNVDTHTFYGAYNYILRYLLSNYPDCKYIVMTPTKNNFHHPTKNYPTTLQTNDLGLHQGDYVKAIKQVAHLYGQPVIDLYNNSGMSPFIKVNTKFQPDGLHYSQAGYKRLQRRIASQLLNYL